MEHLNTNYQFFLDVPKKSAVAGTSYAPIPLVYGPNSDYSDLASQISKLRVLRAHQSPHPTPSTRNHEQQDLICRDPNQTRRKIGYARRDAVEY